ncbi:hypothetical protein [Prevotella sp. HUN102]|uniref:hypothetical protein n=1 Tax=Prevotella sp. HUN102 TaxID=1392486 RepID=UPI00048F1B16|nr:hypothetical protein [Prevotella sp. HUN102]
MKIPLITKEKLKRKEFTNLSQLIYFHNLPSSRKHKVEPALQAKRGFFFDLRRQKRFLQGRQGKSSKTLRTQKNE